MSAVVGAGAALLVVTWRQDHPPQAPKPPAVETADPVVPKAPVRSLPLVTVLPHPPMVTHPSSSEAAPVLAKAASPPPRPHKTPVAQASATATPGGGRYVEAPGYSPYPPGDQRAEAAPEPEGFRLNAKICGRAANQSDPLAQTPECQAILQAAKAQAEACARAFEAGDDKVVLSPACRQAAMGR
jgi:hypothetical protein